MIRILVVHLQFARKSLLTILCLLLSSLARSHLYTKCIWLKNIKKATPFISFALKQTKKQKKNGQTPRHHVVQSQQSNYLGTTPRIDCLLSKVLNTSSLSEQVIQPTHRVAWRVLAPRKKRRQQGLIVQRCCSTEHALHYNNCRLNVSETNAFHKTCLIRLHLS